MTTFDCGVTVKEYGHLLTHDARYVQKAQRISELTRDLSEIRPAFEEELWKKLAVGVGKRVIYHPPCTQQHGQQIRGKVESLPRATDPEIIASVNTGCETHPQSDTDIPVSNWIELVDAALCRSG